MDSEEALQNRSSDPIQGREEIRRSEPASWVWHLCPTAFMGLKLDLMFYFHYLEIFNNF